MKNTIVTMAVGNNDKINFLKETTLPIIKEYCYKTDCELIVIDELKINFEKIVWEKFQVYDILKYYDRVLFIDLDSYIRKDCPNLFDIVPSNKYASMEVSNHCDDIWINQFFEEMKNTYPDLTFPNSFQKEWYPTGLFIVTKHNMFLFENPKYDYKKTTTESKFKLNEEFLLNYRIVKYQVDVFRLNYKFNYVFIHDSFPPSHRRNSYIIHYAHLEIPIDEYCKLIENDIKDIEINDDKYINNVRNRSLWISKE